jgi:hypothetical protein
MRPVKSVKRKKNPPKSQIPRILKTPDSTARENIVWRFGILDKEGPWGWSDISKELILNEIHSKLSNFETMTIPQLQLNGSHFVEVNILCRDAQKRLDLIRQDDNDELFSLRLSGKKRIWGIVNGNIFSVLWWDPDHAVCPSNLKHT